MNSTHTYEGQIEIARFHAAWCGIAVATGIAFVCLSLIVILSLIPGRWQERTTLSGPLEHFGAYLITAMIIGLAARRRHNPIYLVIGLSLVSAVLEILQYWSPGRDPQFVGFFGSVAGALVGAPLANRIRTE